MADTQDRERNIRVGRNLQEIREMSGYTRSDLAAALPVRTVTRRHIAHLENGTRNLTRVMAARIAKVLEVPVDRLLNPPTEDDEDPVLAAAS